MSIKNIAPLVILVVVFVSSSINMVHSITPTTLGTATYYTHYVPSACFGKEDPGKMVVALNPESFHDELCGKELKAICVPGDADPNPCKNANPIVVKITHICPPEVCPTYADIALSWEAFSFLADPKVNSIGVNYVYLEDNVPSL